ncbi:MAG: 50S ribosomal protein L34e [Candidatus Bathyarchaeota archaeon]|nr:50S ribosomal protein L34e [Candidatus Bathyarchaeota archaeon]
MPRPSLRTRSRKLVKKALPGGRSKYHFEKEKTKAPPCFLCGKPIAGIPRLNPAEIRKQNRSKRKVSRPYGRQVCHNCLENALKQAARQT